MAKAVGLSQTAIYRIWQAFGLQPHRHETFKLSSDPFFVEKVRDVVGLYLNPPERAIVLCVDEKSQVQALDPIVQGITRRQEEARDAEAGRSHALQQGEPVSVRQSPVDDQRAVWHLVEGRPGGIHAAHHVGCDARGVQPLAHQLGQPLMIFDQENAVHQKRYR